MGGRLPNGQPKMRLVWGSDAIRPHGIAKGQPKYYDPSTLKPFECWILEQWFPPSMCGTREEWKHEMMGPYPADCHEDCCNGGFWGIRSPIIYGDGTAPKELTDAVMRDIQTMQFFDHQWSMDGEISRLHQLETALASRDHEMAETIDNERRQLDDWLLTNKEKLDAADTRVSNVGAKMPAKPNVAPFGNQWKEQAQSRVFVPSKKRLVKNYGSDN